MRTESTSSNSEIGRETTWSNNLQAFGIGALLGFGTYANTFSTVDLLLAVWVFWILVRGHKPPSWSYLLLASLWVSAIGGGAPLVTGYWGGRIWLLAVLGSWAYRRVTPEYLAVGFIQALALQTGLGVLHLFDQHRSWIGLSWNLTVLSHTGLAALIISTRLRSWAYITALVLIPVAGARAALGAGVIWVVLRRRPLLLIGLLPIFGLFYFNHGERLNPDSIQRAYETRKELLVREVEVTPTPIPTPAPQPTVIATQSPAPTIEPTYTPARERPQYATEPIERARGYEPVGFAAYNFAGVPPKPHNGYVLLWYEMGILAVLPLVLVVYGWRKGIIPLALIVSYAAYSWFELIPVGRADGHFTVALVLLFFAASKSPDSEKPFSLLDPAE